MPDADCPRGPHMSWEHAVCESIEQSVFEGDSTQQFRWNGPMGLAKYDGRFLGMLCGQYRGVRSALAVANDNHFLIFQLILMLQLRVVNDLALESLLAWKTQYVGRLRVHPDRDDNKIKFFNVCFPSQSTLVIVQPDWPSDRLPTCVTVVLSRTCGVTPKRSA